MPPVSVFCPVLDGKRMLWRLGRARELVCSWWLHVGLERCRIVVVDRVRWWSLGIAMGIIRQGAMMISIGTLNYMLVIVASRVCVCVCVCVCVRKERLYPGPATRAEEDGNKIRPIVSGQLRSYCTWESYIALKCPNCKSRNTFNGFLPLKRLDRSTPLSK
jgi:hypothetical protein